MSPRTPAREKNHWLIEAPKWVEPTNDGRPTPHVGRTVALMTPRQVKKLPDGFVLVDIFGAEYVKGTDEIDMDTRCGYTAYGTLVPAPPSDQKGTTP